MGHRVVIFGAGATKACNGPMTNEILFQAFLPEVLQEIDREYYLPTLDDFLVSNFHVPKDFGMRRREDYPGLPLLMSLIDAAIDRGQPFGNVADPAQMRNVRASLEYVIFAVLDFRLKRLQLPTPYERMLRVVYPSPLEPQVISLNYDIIADNVLVALGESRSSPVLPDYRCDIGTEAYVQREGRFGKLLKLHGSLNWMYCPGCHRLDIAFSRTGVFFAKALNDLYQESGDDQSLDFRYSCHGSPCRDCGIYVRPVMITPTQKKDYRNPHIARVWYEAERMLRQADSAIFVGYSLPEDDVEVAYLLKRGLNHLPPAAITVIEFDSQLRPLDSHPVGQRYRTLFGDGIDWFPGGFVPWVEQQELNI